MSSQFFFFFFFFFVFFFFVFFLFFFYHSLIHLGEIRFNKSDMAATKKTVIYTCSFTNIIQCLCNQP